MKRSTFWRKSAHKVCESAETLLTLSIQSSGQDPNHTKDKNIISSCPVHDQEHNYMILHKFIQVNHKYINLCNSTFCTKNRGDFMQKTEYVSFNIALRIKEVAKKRDIVLRQMLEEIGLSKGTMDNLRTSMPKADNLAKIADYLDVSMDYLMGRTDEPDIKNNSNIIRINSGNSSHISDIANVKISQVSSEDIAEISEMLKDLSLVQRSEIVLMIDKMRKQAGNYNFSSDYTE